MPQSQEFPGKHRCFPRAQAQAVAEAEGKHFDVFLSVLTFSMLILNLAIAESTAGERHVIPEKSIA